MNKLILLFVTSLMALVVPSALSAQNSNPTVLITEVASDPRTSGSEYIEIMNVSSGAINIAGYKMTIYDNSTAVRGTKTISGKTLQPMETYVLADTSAIGGNPHNDEYLGFNILWNTGYSGGVMLQDNQNNVIDFMCWGTVQATGITSPASAAPHWNGSPISQTVVFDNSFERFGQADNDNNMDWRQLTGDTLDMINVDLNIVAGTTWTGSASSDWQDDANWDAGVPTDENGCIIPNASTTANDPILPVAFSLKAIKIEAGGILVGASGAVVQVKGDYTNEGGVYIPMDGVLEFSGDDDQEIICGGQGLGNVLISNTAGKIFVKDSWTAANTGEVTLESGAVMVFEADTNDFSGNTFVNDGLIELGLTGGGAVAVVQTIETGGTNIGNVKITAEDAMDTVEFPSNAGFGDLEVTGTMGNVNFTGDVEINGDTTFGIFGGIVTFAGSITGEGDLVFNASVPITIPANVTADTMAFTGDADLTVNGSVTLKEELRVSPIGPLAVLTTGAVTIGDMDNTGTLNVDSLGVNPYTINGDVVTDNAFFSDGAVTCLGSISADVGTFSADETVSFAGLTNSFTESLTLGGMGTFSTAGTTITGTLDISDSVNFNPNNLTVSGDLFSLTTGMFAVGGALSFNGTQNQQVQTSALLQANQFIFDNLIGVDMTGPFAATSNLGGATTAGFIVNNGAGVTIKSGSTFELGAPGGGGRMRVSGSFVIDAGDVDTMRPEFMPAMNADNPRMTVYNTGVVHINGARFTNFGRPSQNYAIDMQLGSTLASFNFVEITGVDAAVAAVHLGSFTVPGQIDQIYMTGNGANFDANDIQNLQIDITEDDPDGGNLYGVANELDMNNVLYWENPPAVDILGTGVLANALVENPYSDTPMAVGGNFPLTWSITNAPDWLSINPVSGELTGTPTASDIGIVQFVIFAADSSPTQIIGSKVMTLTVDSLTTVQLAVISANPIDGLIGDLYGYSLTASGGSDPYFWEALNAADLPPGLSLSQAGQILGVPTAEGVFTFVVVVRDNNQGQALKSMSITIRNELNNPETIAAALSDGGGGGGCALSSATNYLWLTMLALLSGVVVIRRRRLS